VCRWLPVDGRNSLRYDLPYTLYVSAVNALGRVSSTPRTIDTTSIGTPCRRSAASSSQLKVTWIYIAPSPVTEARRCDHITPVMRQLHWLPVRQRVEYKVACKVHQSPAGQTPAYIADDIQLVADSDRRQLCSAAARTCLVPRTHNNFGDQSFNAAGPACGTVYRRTCDET